MKHYMSKSGKKSGVEAYKLGMDYILVKFWSNEKLYKYTYASAGEKAIEEMKKLASANKGLSSYISQEDPPYEDGNGNFVTRKKEKVL